MNTQGGNPLQGGGTTGTGGAAGGQEDYLDKGLDAAEKRFGGGKVNPEQSRGMNEKVTDGARGLFEKATGKKAPEKFSN